MKPITRLLLWATAVVLLATGTARAETKWPSPNFVADCRRDFLYMYFDKEDYEAGFGKFLGGKDGDDESRVGIRIPIDKAARARLEKELRDWKKCDAYLPVPSRSRCGQGEALLRQ